MNLLGKNATGEEAERAPSDRIRRGWVEELKSITQAGRKILARSEIRKLISRIIESALELAEARLCAFFSKAAGGVHGAHRPYAVTGVGLDVHSPGFDAFPDPRCGHDCLKSSSRQESPTADGGSGVSRALLANENWIGLLIEKSSDILTITEADGTIRWESPSVTRILGYQPEENIGKTIFSLFHEDDQTRACSYRDNFLREPGGSSWITLRVRHRDGGYRHHEVVGTNLLDHPDFRCVLFTSRDITERRQMEQILRESEQKARLESVKFERIYRVAPVGLCFIDTELRYLRINDRLAAMHGRPAEEHIGRPIREVLPEMANELEPIYRRVIATCQPILDIELSSETVAEPGVKRNWVASFHPVQSADGSVLGVTVVVAETTAQVRALQALRESEQRLQLVVGASRDTIWEWDAAPDILRYWRNEPVELLHGPEIGQPWNLERWIKQVHLADRERVRLGFKEALGGTAETWSDEYRVGRPDGDFAWIINRASIVRDADGLPVRLIGSEMDISERKELQTKLEQQLKLANDLNALLRSKRMELEHANSQLADLVEHDPLTGLKNRHYFFEALEKLFERACRESLELSVIMLDVDHFKAYNDTLGHLAGDEVLRQVAGILQQNLRAGEIIARYGGEEFVVVLPGAGPEDACRSAERLRTAIAEFPWPHRPVTVSLGAASANPIHSEAVHLLEHADQALYLSKRAGRNCVHHFSAIRPQQEPPSRTPFLVHTGEDAS